MDTETPALSALLSPRTPAEFFSEFWPDKSTYFLAGGDLAHLPEFLRTEELHNIEAMAKSNKGGVWVSNAAKSGHMMKIDRRAAPYAYGMGLTVYLDDVTAGLPGAAGRLASRRAGLGSVGWARLCDLRP